MMECKKRSGGSQGRPGRSAKSFCASAASRRPRKKASRATKQGVIGTYIHPGGQLGVMVEVNCESDFVARTDDFQELVHDIAMQIAAADPQFIRKEDVTADVLDKEKEIAARPRSAEGQAREDGRQDRRRPHGEVLRRGLPARTAVHQGTTRDRRAADRRPRSPSSARTSRSRASSASRSATRSPAAADEQPRLLPAE